MADISALMDGFRQAVEQHMKTAISEILSQNLKTLSSGVVTYILNEPSDDIIAVVNDATIGLHRESASPAVNKYFHGHGEMGPIPQEINEKLPQRATYKQILSPNTSMGEKSNIMIAQ